MMLEGWRSQCRGRGNPPDLIRSVQPDLMPFCCGLQWVQWDMLACGLVCGRGWRVVRREVVGVGGNTDLEAFCG